MIISISHNKKDYRLDKKNSFDIYIPYNFNGAQPNFYDVKEGRLTYFQSQDTIYSVADGAGCNVPEISLNIHCSGTHTECVGHLLEKSGDVGKVLTDMATKKAAAKKKKAPAKKKVAKKPEVKRIEKEEKKDKVDSLLDNFFKRGRK